MGLGIFGSVGDYGFESCEISFMFAEEVDI